MKNVDNKIIYLQTDIFQLLFFLVMQKLSSSWKKNLTSCWRHSLSPQGMSWWCEASWCRCSGWEVWCSWRGRMYQDWPPPPPGLCCLPRGQWGRGWRNVQWDSFWKILLRTCRAQQPISNWRWSSCVNLQSGANFCEGLIIHKIMSLLHKYKTKGWQLYIYQP